jgi:hypothetical protein
VYSYFAALGGSHRGECVKIEGVLDQKERNRNFPIRSNRTATEQEQQKWKSNAKIHGTQNMKFERLPNELLLDIFEYFDGIHLFRAFYGLNSRLNNLINTSVKSYQLDFRGASKSDYNFIYCQSIADKVLSIHIADGDETPNLPEIYFSHHFTAPYYIQLQSLSLYSIYSIDTLNTIVLQCHRLPCLTNLKFIQCLLNNAPNYIINIIWKLSKLINCVIDEDMLKGECFVQLSEISSSIKYLSIDDVNCDFLCLTNILQQTPCLERLSTKIISLRQNEQLSIVVPLLTQLTLSFRGSIETLRNLFQQMINLRSLIYYRSDLSLTGNEWEDIFIQYLSNVKYFRVKMNFQFSQHDNIEDKIDELLATFQTDFWIKKHQWFVRSDWNPADPLKQVSLYTLPYAFNEYHLSNELYSKSTCLNDEDFWSYKQVENLQCKQNSSNHCPIQFPNLSQLEMILPFNENLFFNIPSLDHLTSLDVTLLPGDSVYHQLETILNRAPHLYVLRFSHISELEMRLFQLNNPSIRRLDFFTKESILDSWHFNREHCLALANSSLGQQCQTLVINVEDRTNILDLINHMTKLQSLTFQCKEDKWNYKPPISTTDELLQWFYEHLPSTCSISRHINRTSIFRLWIC